MDLGLKGKIVLVTGAGEGIGRRAILTFAEEGTNIDINDIIASRAENVAREVEVIGVKSLAVAADVSNANEVNDMVKRVLDEFGRIDVLVNNAFAWDRKLFSKSAKRE